MKTLKMLPGVTGYAVFSDCQKWRYYLLRHWDLFGPSMMFIGLNPSTATGEVDDPTIRRCQQFARREGCGIYRMANLFGFRSTDPKGLRTVDDPVGPDNDRIIEWMVRRSDIVVCAWGAHSHPLIKDRADMVLAMIKRPMCLGTTKGGFPKHPLYVPGNAQLVEYRR